MKKAFLLITVLLSVLIFSGCEKDEIEILPDTINVVYDNARYKDGNFYVDTHITNGFEDDMYIGDMDFGIYPIDSEIEVAGAEFYMDINIEAGGYVSIELEFGTDYVYVSEEELSELGFEVIELELYFWIVD